MNQDNLDPNGEIAETPTDSQSEMITAGDGDTVNPQGAATLNPEEANWNSLSGSSQDRFRQVTQQINRERQLREAAEARQAAGYGDQTPTVNNSASLAPSEREAIRKLNEDYGIAMTKDVERTVDEKVNQRLGGLVYNMELDRMENKYDGSNSLPAFSRAEYEAFLASNPEYRNYKLDDVYEKMFPREVLQYKLGNVRQSNGTRPSPSLRPTRTQVREEQWTPEAIEARLAQPDGPEWYDKNKELVNAVVTKTA